MAIFNTSGVFSGDRRPANDLYYTERPPWWPQPQASQGPRVEPATVSYSVERGQNGRGLDWILFLLDFLMNNGRAVGEPTPVTQVIGQNQSVPFALLTALGNINSGR